MKVFVKTLEGTQFEIEVTLQDTVADVKKNIETVQGGPDVYPAAKQMLIHQGKMIKDATTMEENGVSENSYIRVMLTKPKSSSVLPPPSPPPRVAAPAPALPPPPTSSTIASPSTITSPTHPAEIRNLAGVIRRILDKGEGRWNGDTVIYAAEYLSSGSLPPIDRRAEVSSPPPAVPVPPPITYELPPANTIGPNGQPLYRLSMDLPPGFGSGGKLDLLQNNPEFHNIRRLVQANPQLLQPVHEQFVRENPERVGILEHEDEFLRLILQPDEEGEGEVGQPDSEPWLGEPFTDEDVAALDRLEALGFRRTVVVEVYLECDRNEQQAANYLLDHMDELQQ